MDLAKVFYSIFRDGICQISTFYGIPTRIVELIRSWYVGINNYVRPDLADGYCFPIMTDLRQRCVVSPSLLNVYMDAMPRKMTEGSAEEVLWDRTY